MAKKKSCSICGRTGDINTCYICGDQRCDHHAGGMSLSNLCCHKGSGYLLQYDGEHCDKKWNIPMGTQLEFKF